MRPTHAQGALVAFSTNSQAQNFPEQPIFQPKNLPLAIAMIPTVPTRWS